MQSLKELEKYIELQGEAHAEEDDDYELIEIDTYREIIRFSLAKGFTIDNINFEIFLDEADEEKENADEKGCWNYFSAILEFVSNDEEKNEIPLYLKHLDGFFHKTFWPE